MGPKLLLVANTRGLPIVKMSDLLSYSSYSNTRLQLKTKLPDQCWFPPACELLVLRIDGLQSLTDHPPVSLTLLHVFYIWTADRKSTTFRQQPNHTKHMLPLTAAKGSILCSLIVVKYFCLVLLFAAVQSVQQEWYTSEV